MVIAVFPGTFDPMTLGHVGIARRAARLFDQLIVAVAESKNKNPFIPFDDRVRLVSESLCELTNIRVVSFSCLLIDLAHQLNAQAIIRGLRAVSDFEYEFQLASMNRCLDPDIDSVFLAPEEAYTFLSSSLIKETYQLSGKISRWVPDPVIQYLENNQHGPKNH